MFNVSYCSYEASDLVSSAGLQTEVAFQVMVSRHGVQRPRCATLFGHPYGKVRMHSAYARDRAQLFGCDKPLNPH